MPLTEAQQRVTVSDLAIAEICCDISTQFRPAYDKKAIAHYAALIKDGVVLDPIDVYWDRLLERKYLAHGWHRLRAMKLAGQTIIQARVRLGTLRDAVELAIEANKKNGVPEDDETRRRKLWAILCDEDWKDLSKPQVATKLGCCRRVLYNWYEEWKAREPEIRAEVEARSGTRDIDEEELDENTETTTTATATAPQSATDPTETDVDEEELDDDEDDQDEEELDDDEDDEDDEEIIEEAKAKPIPKFTGGPVTSLARNGANGKHHGNPPPPPPPSPVELKSRAQLADGEFLESIPVRAKLAPRLRPAFDRSALLRRDAQPHLDALRRLMRKPKVGESLGLFEQRLGAFLRIPAYHAANLCIYESDERGKCTDGLLPDGNACPSCYGRGYVL
jgi:hypothetical protein